MSEVDPNGKSANEPGAKLDAGKVRPALVIQGFRRALLAVSEVGTFGAAKYTDDGWKSVTDGRKRYEDALYRHLLAEGVDEQSGLPHLAHAAWNLLAMLELEQIASMAPESPPQELKSKMEDIREQVKGVAFAQEEMIRIGEAEIIYDDPRFGMMTGEWSAGGDSDKGCFDCFYGCSRGRGHHEYPQGNRTSCPHLQKANQNWKPCETGSLIVWTKVQENK